MFANRIALPFLLLALLFLYLAWEIDSVYGFWMMPFLVLVTIIYVMAPQINWWWYTRNPPELAPPLLALLERFHPVYRRLPESDRKVFRNRVALFNMGVDWMPMAFPEDTLPPDVQTVIAAQAVALTLNKPEFLFDRFEKVIVYPRPFPTEVHQFAHASELYEPDGCLLFSAEQVMLAFFEPAAWYNVALHEYARAFVLKYPGEAYPALDNADIWEKLETASQMPRTHVESVIGIENADPLAVAIHHYHIFPERFRAVLPEAARQFDGIFRAKGAV